ncbi:hypothetical protein VB834_25280 [Limnoraphis robusta Tam1]|uniref:hypothetical protein n=1 Tax=Limnoraphis robusta TaxID=1118279 RepID=UPI002B200C18|nr:hypothetical protein [Limnoraphis robusta]MEA5498196.1 hypothetical protein [Limnoraphis robusta BA-68 BA1]MEA5542347.1 hypothetical protein [Limnoraphis robusta Tam1]
MTWKQSIRLEPLNELFSKTGIKFKKDEVQGGYIAQKGSKTIRRPTLMKCAQAVLEELMQ